MKAVTASCCCSVVLIKRMHLRVFSSKKILWLVDQQSSGLSLAGRRQRSGQIGGAAGASPAQSGGGGGGRRVHRRRGDARSRQTPAAAAAAGAGRAEPAAGELRRGSRPVQTSQSVLRAALQHFDQGRIRLDRKFRVEFALTQTEPSKVSFRCLQWKFAVCFVSGWLDLFGWLHTNPHQPQIAVSFGSIE